LSNADAFRQIGQKLSQPRNWAQAVLVDLSSQSFGEKHPMKKLIAGAAGIVMLSGIAFAQAPQIMSSVPAQSVTVTDWYKQSVYDPSNSKIGEIMDVLLSADGKVNALIIGVGGFLGMGEKDVAVPFSAVKHTTRDGKVYLTLDTTKDALKAAPGLKYDRSSTTWMPDTK
jgi:sporulation protein YlmC with PRC-barrel domain